MLARPASRPRGAALPVAVVLLTAAFRLAVDLRSGGLLGAGSIDDGVHYAASAALLAGRAPYRDLLFLHPPGVLLALLPFTAAARVVGDPAAFAAARLAGILLGAVNAGFVAVVLRRRGAAAQLAGAAVYACSWPVVFAERTALLEPVGCALLLAALALVVDPPSRRRAAVAGALLGAACAVKLTFVLPALVVVLALRRRAPVAALAATAVAAAVCLPFLLAAPEAMPRMLVADQLGRRRIVPLLGVRLAAITVPPPIPGVPQRAVLGAVLLLATAAVIVGLATPGARRFAVMAVAEIAALLAAPSFYGHYAVLALLPLSVLVGTAVGRTRRGLPRAAPRAVATTWVAVLVAAVVLGAWTPARLAKLSDPPLEAGIADALRATDGCATADAATTLVLADVLTRDLQRGCAVRPDVTGWQYDPAGRTPGDPPLWPVDDPVYQRVTADWLRSGSVLALTHDSDGLSAATRERLLSGPVLHRGEQVVVARTP
ncbi:hypothetical protein [Amnibacterium endophyticum]|uniref:DUF2029 domain-containing protein n=1 Tax=Amnibacterium endophyticum TaxID=2109337 RepID=A0ABW4LG88_9MICO